MRSWIASPTLAARYCACPFGPMMRSYPPMPWLSSADTLPEYSSASFPVSTIADPGVMTRIPRVCMSIVASAFQYGCAPTLMPVTTTLSSPPRSVNSTMRQSTMEIQSMFSVPLSIEILAPAETANHSSGTLRSEEHTSELQSRENLVCRLL